MANEYDSLFATPPAAVAPIAPPAKAQAAVAAAPQAPQTALGDPDAVKRNDAARRAASISSTNPYMHLWMQGDPVKVAASQDDFDFLNNWSEAWQGFQKGLFVQPGEQRRPFEKPGGEVGYEAAQAGQQIVAGYDPNKARTDLRAAGYGAAPDIADWLGKNVPGYNTATTLAGNAINTGFAGLAGLLSPYTGQVVSNVGNPLEQAVGLRREITQQIAMMLLPGMPKGGLRELVAKGAKPPLTPAGGEKPPPPEADFHVRDAENNAHAINILRTAAQDNPLFAKSPETMQDFVDQHAGATTLHIDADKIMEAYASAGHAPFEKDGLLGWMPDLPGRLRDAVETGGDVEVPIRGYLTNVDDKGHAALADGIRLGDSRSVDDANEFAHSEELFAKNEPAGLDSADDDSRTLRVARQMPDGTIRVGEKGDTHGALLEPEENVPDEHMGFVTPDGKFLSRLEAKEYRDTVLTKKEEPVAKAARVITNRVKQDHYLNPLFKSAKDANMSEAQFKGYAKAIEAADAALQERMMGLAKKQVEREHSTEWKERAAQVEPAVRDQLGNSPQWRARHFLMTGEFPEGKAPIDPVKLDKREARAQYGDIVDELPQGIFGKNGVGADDVAEVLGFRNGQSMLENIKALEDLRKSQEAQIGTRINASDHYEHTVKWMTNTLVDKELGGFMSEEGIENEARQAARSPEVKRLLTAELQALADKAGLPFDKNTVRFQAEESFKRMSVSDAQDIRGMERQIGRNGRKAEEHLLKGNAPEAFKAKMAQLINNHLLDLIHDFTKDFRKDLAKMKRQARVENIPNVQQDYTNHIHDILNTMGIRTKRDPIEIKDSLSQSLPDFIQSNLADGFQIPYEGISAPPAQGGIKDMNVGDWSANTDTLHALEHVGRYFSQLERLGKKMALEEGMDRVRAQRAAMRDKFTREDLMSIEDSTKKKMASAWRSFDAINRTMEFLADRFDGHDLHGIFNDMLVHPFQKGKHLYDSLMNDINDAYTKFAKTLPDDWGKRLDDRIDVSLTYQDGDKDPYRPINTKGDLISAAMHWGNPENRWKLLSGYKWHENDLQPFFDKHMTKNDWDFVQFYWDHSDKVFDMSQDMYKRITGVGTKKVQRVPFTTPFGQYAGGHAPVYYDARIGRDVKDGGPDSLFSTSYQRGLPSKGYTNRRTGFTAPVQLGFDMVRARYQQMIHDLSYREAVLNGYKFLKQDPVRLMVEKTLGPEYYNIMKDYPRRIAGAKDIPDVATGFVEKFLAKARTNIVSTMIGFNPRTIGKHFFTGLAKSIAEVGGKNLAAAFADMSRDGPEGYERNIAAIKAESPEMARRHQNIERDFRTGVETLFKEQGFVQKWQEWGSYGIATSDRVTAFPTYWAARNLELEKGSSIEDAILAGEKAVRRAHGASAAVDLAPIMDPRGAHRNAMKLFSTFMTFMNNGYNRIAESAPLYQQAGRALGEGKYKEATSNFGHAFYNTFYNLLTPAAIAAVISGGIAEVTNAKRMIGATGEELVAGLPGISQIAHAAMYAKGNEPVQLSPAESVLGDFVQTLFKDVPSLVVDQKLSPKALQRIFDEAGFVTGVPLHQPGKAAVYMYDWLTGNEDPKSPLI